MACTSSSVTPLSGNCCRSHQHHHHRHHHSISPQHRQTIVIITRHTWSRDENKRGGRRSTHGYLTNLVIFRTKYHTHFLASFCEPQMSRSTLIIVKKFFIHLEKGVFDRMRARTRALLRWARLVTPSKARNHLRPITDARFSLVFTVPSRAQWLPSLRLLLSRRRYLNDAPPRPPHGCGHVLVRFIVQAEGRRRLDSVDVSQKRSPLRLLLHRHLALEIRKRSGLSPHVLLTPRPPRGNQPSPSPLRSVIPLLQS